MGTPQCKFPLAVTDQDLEGLIFGRLDFQNRRQGSERRWQTGVDWRHTNCWAAADCLGYHHAEFVTIRAINFNSPDATSKAGEGEGLKQVLEVVMRKLTSLYFPR